MLLFQKGKRLPFFVIMILVFGLTHCQTLPTEPVPCTNENRGHCECGNVSQGFHTYTFWIGEMQRCFTVFHPVSREKERLPVFFWSNCYAADQLEKLGFDDENSSTNKAATRYRVWVEKIGLKFSLRPCINFGLEFENLTRIISSTGPFEPLPPRVRTWNEKCHVCSSIRQYCWNR